MAEVVPCPSCGTKNRVPVAAKGDPRCPKCHTPLPWLVQAGDREFDDAIATARTVLVDLWAPWCGPCRAVAPILERLAVDLAGSLKVVKVNVDQAPAVARRFNATSIPLLVFLRDGRVVDTLVGAHPEHVLRARLDRLASGPAR